MFSINPLHSRLTDVYTVKESANEFKKIVYDETNLHAILSLKSLLNDKKKFYAIYTEQHRSALSSRLQQQRK